MVKKSVLPLLVLALSLAGCAPKSSGPSALRVWHWMTDRDAAFQELAKRYEQETQIPVRFELYAPSDVYVQKVRSAAQTNGLPEIYGVLGESRDLASFIRAGHVLRLDETMDNASSSPWRSVFFPKALAVNAFGSRNAFGIPEGVYGVPIDVMNIQLFYNTRLLAQLGLDPSAPPSTWDAFLQVGQLAKDRKLIGFVSGWAELWLIDCLATNYAIHEMGMDKVEATYRGKVPYTDRGWVNVLSRFAEMRDSGLLAEGIVTMVNKRAEQLFANGQAVFALNGTWGVNVYRGMNPKLEYGVMMPPRVHERAMVTWGGAGSSFVVNAKAPRQDEAITFLRWLTAEPQQRYLLEVTNNIPANRLAAASGLSPELAAFADDMDATIHPRLFSVQEDSPVIEALDKGIQAIIIGEATPESVAAQVQQVKERQRQRQPAPAVTKVRPGASQEASHAVR